MLFKSFESRDTYEYRRATGASSSGPSLIIRTPNNFYRVKNQLAEVRSYMNGGHLEHVV